MLTVSLCTPCDKASQQRTTFACGMYWQAFGAHNPTRLYSTAAVHWCKDGGLSAVHCVPKPSVTGAYPMAYWPVLTYPVCALAVFECHCSIICM